MDKIAKIKIQNCYNYTAKTKVPTILLYKSNQSKKASFFINLDYNKTDLNKVETYLLNMLNVVNKLKDDKVQASLKETGKIGEVYRLIRYESVDGSKYALE